jgi:hypothetical protein
MRQNEDKEAKGGNADAEGTKLIVKATMAVGESFQAFKERIIASFRAAGCFDREEETAKF